MYYLTDNHPNSIAISISQLSTAHATVTHASMFAYQLLTFFLHPTYCGDLMHKFSYDSNTYFEYILILLSMCVHAKQNTLNIHPTYFM